MVKTKSKPRAKKSKSLTKKAPKSSKKIFGAKELKEFRKKLEGMQTDLTRIVQKKREEVLPEQEVGDEADIAVRSLTRDLVFEQSGNELRILEEVESALRRLEKGVFGLCESCGDKIANLRLKAMPYARYCIRCQARFESV